MTDTTATTGGKLTVAAAMESLTTFDTIRDWATAEDDDGEPIEVPEGIEVETIKNIIVKDQPGEFDDEGILIAWGGVGGGPELYSFTRYPEAGQACIGEIEAPDGGGLHLTHCLPLDGADDTTRLRAALAIVALSEEEAGRTP
jgi:hypothetical protein